MTKEERAAARKILHRGDMTIIAQAAGVSRASVTAWFDGTHEDSVCEPFVEAQVAMRKEETEKRIQAMLANQKD